MSEMKSSDVAAADFGVHISFRFIRYSEGERSIELQRDPAGTVGGPALVYVPSPARWSAELPDWTRGRRDEILQRIQAHCSHMKDDWVDY
jgi:hypothetical protein